MALAKEKPLFEVQTDYEDDFEQWCYEQAELLRQRRFSEVDLTNVVEELEDMGKNQRCALSSSYRVLVAHLLKWHFQTQLRSRSWESTIDRERDNIVDYEKMNPSLGADAKQIVEGIYRRSVREAAKETELPKSAFPLDCPYAVEQIRDFDWMPE